MGVPSWISDLIGGGAAKIIDSVGSAAKQFITTDADRAAFELELQKAALDVRKLEFEAETQRLVDVDSARKLYATDSLVQKVLALLFTVAFFGFMVFLLVWMQESTLSNTQENLIYAMFGAVSGIMVTIVGFYFGSSKGSQDKNDFARIAQNAQKP
jgi:hypothetical protein